MKRTWHDIVGSLEVRVGEHNGEWIEPDGTGLCDSLGCVIEAIGEWSGVNELTLVLRFTSSGYEIPMSMYGGPDNLGWPHEYEDIRTLLDITVIARGRQVATISGEQVIRDAHMSYEDRINASAIDRPWEQ